MYMLQATLIFGMQQTAGFIYFDRKEQWDTKLDMLKKKERDIISKGCRPTVEHATTVNEGGGG